MTRHRVDAAAVLAAQAPVALVARGDRRQHDLVARLQGGDARADRFDDARGLVAEHVGPTTGTCRSASERSEWHTPQCADAHSTSPGAGLVDVDVVDDRERLGGGLEQGGAHGRRPTGLRRG